MVDASGIMGWAPASYLVPVDDSTLKEETQENLEIVGNDKGRDILSMQHSVHICNTKLSRSTCMRVYVSVLTWMNETVQLVHVKMPCAVTWTC